MAKMLWNARIWKCIFRHFSLQLNKNLPKSSIFVLSCCMIYLYITTSKIKGARRWRKMNYKKKVEIFWIHLTDFTFPQPSLQVNGNIQFSDPPKKSSLLPSAHSIFSISRLNIFFILYYSCFWSWNEPVLSP